MELPAILIVQKRLPAISLKKIFNFSSQHSFILLIKALFMSFKYIFRMYLEQESLCLCALDIEHLGDEYVCVGSTSIHSPQA